MASSDAVTAFFERTNDIVFVLPEKTKRVLTNLTLECVSELILHMLSIPCFYEKFLFSKSYHNARRNMDYLAELATFLLSYENPKIQQRAALICIRASLHRKNAVCMNMAEKYIQFPELACGLLTHALVDPEAFYLHKEYIQFIDVFQKMLSQNMLSPLNVNRVAIAVCELVCKLTEEDFKFDEDEESLQLAVEQYEREVAQLRRLNPEDERYDDQAAQIMGYASETGEMIFNYFYHTKYVQSQTFN